jgi:integrase
MAGELTDRSLKAAIKRASQAGKPQKLFDAKGLYLLVSPPSSPGWRLKFYFPAGHERLMSLGTYPEVTLKRAREKRDEAKRQLADGVDPSVQRKEAKRARVHTFEAVAREWLDKQEKRLAAATLVRDRSRLETFVYPEIGAKPIGKITTAELLACLRKMEAKGIHESALRARSLCGRILRYAIATGRAERDIAADLKGALTAPTTKSFAAIVDPKRIGELLRAIDGYVGQPATAAALKLAPLVFVRPGELRSAEWSEFRLEGKEPEWRIPAAKMKMGEQHIVPLSRQAVAVLEELWPITGEGRYLFPSLRSGERCMSNNTVNAALRRLGYDSDQIVGHGFRAMASTMLNEQGWHPDLIELQLAHAERNKVRAAYNRAERLAERRSMMQAWADYLGTLRERTAQDHRARS